MVMSKLSEEIEADRAGRIDFVVRELTGLSWSRVRGMVAHGCVKINGATCEVIATPVAPGDHVTVCFDPDRRYRTKTTGWSDRTFDIVYEDDDLIVVDKSAGTLTVPTDRAETNTLADRVSVYLSHSRRKRQAWVVHRLDRAVSGLLVFGKHEAIADLLIEQFKHQKPERVYTAIVAGVMSSDEGTFRGHLATGKNLDRYVAPPSLKTEAAITHYRVVRRMIDTTLTEVRLETGKRNQIRVHFAHAGHPVLGDSRYKIKQAKHPLWIRKRIALHGKLLSFVHPVSEERMTFESSLPAAIATFLDKNR